MLRKLYRRKPLRPKRRMETKSEQVLAPDYTPANYAMCWETIPRRLLSGLVVLGQFGTGYSSSTRSAGLVGPGL